MKGKLLTMPLTLIKPHLTEGQLDVILSHDKKQITGTILSSLTDNDHYFIFRKKLYYKQTENEEKVLVDYSGFITMKVSPITFAGCLYDIEIKLYLNNGKVENGEVNSVILPSSTKNDPIQKRPVTRGNYDGPFLKLLKKLLSVLKSFFNRLKN